MSGFSNQLKYLRKKAGLTQKQLAEELNIATSTLIKYEHGEREPNFKTLEAISAYFKVPTDILLGNEEALQDTLNAAMPLASLVDDFRNIAFKYHLIDEKERDMLPDASIRTIIQSVVQNEKISDNLRLQIMLELSNAVLKLNVAIHGSNDDTINLINATTKRIDELKNPSLEE